MKNRLQVFIFIIWLIQACSPEKKPLEPAFYYWKTTFTLAPSERAYLNKIHAGKLFIKFADIARNTTTGETEPFSLLQVKDSINATGLQFVPCFFITNNVFETSGAAATNWLAERILESLESVGSQFGKKIPDWPEIQVDCDWTGGTRSAYFQFLQQLKKKLPPNTILNVTIRLHQYKNPRQTGLPPADRGVLMCYNTGDIESELTSNSIFDPEEAAPYFSNVVPYPIPLDLALPVFSWALVYRDGGLWRIIPEATTESWADTSLFEQSGRMIRVKKATFKGGHYLSAGDHIRLETSTPEILLPAIRLFSGVSLATDARLLFYHLDSMAISRFEPVFIQKLCDTLNQSRI